MTFHLPPNIVFKTSKSSRIRRVIWGCNANLMRLSRIRHEGSGQGERFCIPSLLICMATLILGLVILLTASVTGWAADSKPAPPKPVASQGTSAEQDKAIEAAIKTKLAKSKIGQDGLTVRVQGGVAYWDGTTNIVQHKGSATRMAKSAGALKVVNNIRVSEEAKARAADNLSRAPRGDAKRSETRDQGRPVSSTSSPASDGAPSNATPSDDPPRTSQQPRLVKPTFPPPSGPPQ